MSQKEVELILARELASCLTVPIFLVDPAGSLLYYNEPAERILGLRFEETGEVPLPEWTTAFVPLDEGGAPLPADSLPLVIALRERRPAHRRFWITGMDDGRHAIEVTAFPIIGQADRFLGAVAMFWEVSNDAGHVLGNAGLAGGAGA